MLSLIFVVILVIAPGVHATDCHAGNLYNDFNLEPISGKNANLNIPIGSDSNFLCKSDHAMRGKSPKEEFKIKCINDSANAAKAKWDTTNLNKCKPGCLLWYEITLDQSKDSPEFIYEEDTAGITIKCAAGSLWPATNGESISGVICKTGILTSGGKTAKCQKSCTAKDLDKFNLVLLPGSTSGVVTGSSLAFHCKDNHAMKDKSPEESISIKCINDPANAQSTWDVSNLATCEPVGADTTKKDGLSVGAIVGIAVGSLAIVIIIGVVVYCCCCRKSKTKDSDEEED